MLGGKSIEWSIPALEVPEFAFRDGVPKGIFPMTGLLH